MYDNTLETIFDSKIIAILRNVAEDKLIPLQDVLLEQGIRCLEVTFDQKNENCLEITRRSIQCLRENARGDMEIGAGTVITMEQLDAAKDAGASFIISPDSNREIIEKTRVYGLVSMPGAMTPTEILSAYRWGASIVKVFPAGRLGAAYIHDIRGPINHIPLSAVGGVDQYNMDSFYREGVCCFGIGSNIVKKELLMDNDYEAIGRNARLYTEQIRRWK